MKVVWMPQAKLQLRQTASYIRNEFGKKAREDFMYEVQQANHLLSLNPNMGKREPFLEGRSVMYRSLLVNRLNKMIYNIVDDHIEVAAFWDVRREPESLANQVK